MIIALQDEHWKNVKNEEVDTLILNCLGIELQLNANMPYGVLGEDLQIKVLINNSSSLSVSLNGIKWKDQSYDLNNRLKTNQLFNKSFETKVSGTISSPYWLIQKGSQGMYTTDKTEWIGAAKSPAAYLAELSFSIEGKS